MPVWTKYLQVVPLFLLAMVFPVSVSASNVAIGLVYATALGLFLWQRDLSVLPPKPVMLALLLYVLAPVLATAFSDPYSSNWNKVVEESWLKLLLLAVPILLAGHRKSIVPILRATLVISTLVSFYAIWQHFVGIDLVRNRSLMTEWGHFESVGFFGHKLSYGGQLMLIILVGIAMAFKEGINRWQMVLIPALGFMGLALLWSYARSAQIGLWVGLLVLLVAWSGWAPLGWELVLWWHPFWQFWPCQLRKLIFCSCFHWKNTLRGSICGKVRGRGSNHVPGWALVRVILKK